MERRRHGPSVFAYVVLLIVVFGGLWALLNRPEWELIGVDRVVGTAAGGRLQVTVGHSQCRHDPRVRVVSEGVADVRIRAEHNTNGGCEDVGLQSTFDVDLEEVLAGRAIVIEAEPRAADERPLVCLIDGRDDDRCTAVPPERSAARSGVKGSGRRGAGP